MQSIRGTMIELMNQHIENPVIINVCSHWQTTDEHLIFFSAEAGGLLIDGFGDGLWINISNNGQNNFPIQSEEKFLNTTAFGILQAARTRISKTEYISCPGCGRTLFDLQTTTEKIRSVTNHLKNVKIAVMGCIVNGPGEMADADFGYVGSGAGNITLYKGKDIVKRNIPSQIAVYELINLLKENNVWVEKDSSETMEG
jgi:(E)-4-hydroxy-3-methylbut-2-enyl-diphosphate synthase